VADGVRAERRPDGALLKIFDRGGKRAGAKDKREIMGTLLAEVSSIKPESSIRPLITGAE